jgi:hypothetical protein
MKITVDRYNDVWYDNGLITFSNLLDELEKEYELKENQINPIQLKYEFSDTQKFTEELSNQIKGNIPYLIVETKDKTTLEKKQVKKDFILIQEGKKIGGKVALKEDIFKEEKTHEVIKQLYENLDGGKKACFICGRKFKSSYKNLQQASYPFVTKIKSITGIRSGKELKLTEYIKDYCPHCYLNGILVWLDQSLIYRTIPGEKSIIILPYLDNLENLKRLKRSFYKLLNKKSRYCNIKIDIEKDDTENTPDKYSTLISFYENFLRYTKPDLNCQNWYIVEIPLSGSVKNPKYYNVYLEEKIVNVLSELQTEGYLFYRGFIQETYFFNNDPKKSLRNFDIEREIHEVFCKSMVNDNFNEFTHFFLPRTGGHIGLTKGARQVLDNLILEWRIKTMKVLDESDVKTLQMAGQTIASLSRNRVSLFYKLEKAKNPHDFYKAIQEISRRFIIDETNVKVYPGSINNVLNMVITNQENPKAFEDIKNILLIYASIRGYKQTKSKEDKDE